MKFFNRLSPLDRFIFEGGFRGVLSTIPASILFSIVFEVSFYARNGEFPFNENYPAHVAIGTSIAIGLFFSFLPSLIGSWALAHWIYAETRKRTLLSGAIKGLACGATAMFGFDFLIGLALLTFSHGPSMEMFMFYVISSTVIAALTGAVIGLQLMNKILKAEILS